MGLRQIQQIPPELENDCAGMFTAKEGLQKFDRSISRSRPQGRAIARTFVESAVQMTGLQKMQRSGAAPGHYREFRRDATAKGLEKIAAKGPNRLRITDQQDAKGFGSRLLRRKSDQ